MSLHKIAHSINNSKELSYEKDIPINVIRAILRRAMQKYEFIELKDDLYYLTELGNKYIDSMESKENIEFKIQNLIYDLQKYFYDNFIKIDFETLKTTLINFLYDNQDEIANLLNNENIKLKIQNTDLREYGNLILEYMKQLKFKNDSNFEVLRQLYIGAIISRAPLYLSTKNTDINQIRTRKFKDTTIYLDTNFIFSILKLHPEEFSKPAIELLELMKEFKFELKIFDFTFYEMLKVLSFINSHAPYYTNKVKTNSIVTHIKEMNWNRSDIVTFIENLPDKLLKIGIEIENTGLDINNFIPNESTEKFMENYEKEFNSYNKEKNFHDFAAFQLIRNKRKGDKYHYEDAKFYFLTSDKKLFKYIKKNRKLIPEVVLDEFFTGILWLKNSFESIPLETMIMAHSQDLLVNYKIWNKFQNKVNEMASKEEIDEDDISILFYEDFLENDLSFYSENDLDLINEDYILNKKEEIERKINSKINTTVSFEKRKMQKNYEDRENKIVNIFKKKIENIHYEQDKRLLDIYIKSNKEAIRKSNKFYSIIKTTLIILLFLFCVLFIYFYFYQNVSYFFFFFIFSFSTLIFFRSKKMLFYIKKKYYDFIYKKEISESFNAIMKGKFYE